MTVTELFDRVWLAINVTMVTAVVVILVVT